MTNRIKDLIGRNEARIEKLGGENGIGLNGKPLALQHDAMKLIMSEFIQFQILQASAHAQGILSTAEAQTIYIALGGERFQPNWPKGTSLATKVAITQIMGELLQREIKTKRAVMAS